MEEWEEWHKSHPRSDKWAWKRAVKKEEKEKGVVVPLAVKNEGALQGFENEGVLKSLNIEINGGEKMTIIDEAKKAVGMEEKPKPTSTIEAEMALFEGRRRDLAKQKEAVLKSIFDPPNGYVSEEAIYGLLEWSKNVWGEYVEQGAFSSKLYEASLKAMARRDENAAKMEEIKKLAKSMV